MKKAFALLLTCSMVLAMLTGCGSKPTVYTTIDDIKAMKSGDFDLNITLDVKDEEVGKVTMKVAGRATEDVASLDQLVIGVQGVSLTMDNFMIAGKDAAYLNQKSVYDALGLTEYLGDSLEKPYVKYNVSSSGTDASEDVKKASEELAGGMDRLLHTAIDTAGVTEEEGTYTIKVTADNKAAVADALKAAVEENLDGWYDQLAIILADEKVQEALSDSMDETSDSMDTLTSLQEKKTENIEKIKESLEKAFTAMKEAEFESTSTISAKDGTGKISSAFTSDKADLEVSYSMTEGTPEEITIPGEEDWISAEDYKNSDTNLGGMLGIGE